MKNALETRKSFAHTDSLCRFALAFVVSLVMAASCFASSITLQWDPETAPDLGGYKVYYSTNPEVPFAGNGATQGASPVSVSTQASATITGLDPDQPYYFAVTAYNTAGVESPYSNIIAVPELTPPTVSITHPASNSLVAGTVSVSASASDNVEVTRLETYVNGVLQATDTAAPYLFSWNTDDLASGVYTLSAKAFDEAGNVGQSVNVSVSVQKDVAAPVVALMAPGNGATVHGMVPVTAHATDDIAVTNVELYANGTLLFAGNLAPFSYQLDTTALANGYYTLSAKAYDAVGHVGQSTDLLVRVLNDSIPPVVSIAAPIANSKLSRTILVSANATDNTGVTKVEYFINGALASTATAAPFSFSWNTLKSPNGSYSISAAAYDAVGNVGRSLAVPVTLFNDYTAPLVSIVSPAGGSRAGGTVAVSVSAKDNVAVAKVQFLVNGVLQAASTSAPYNFSWNTLKSLNGTYTLVAKAYDAAGNVGQSANVSVTVLNDTIAPSVSISSPVNGGKAGGTVTVSANATDNVGVSKVEFFLNGALQGTAYGAPYNYGWNTVNLADGSYTLSAKAYDAAGNIGQSANVALTLFNDKIAPSVALTVSPIGTASGTVILSAKAYDNVGVAKVEFYRNGVMQASDVSAPYSYSWNTRLVANGSYTLSAKVYDAAGNIGQSAGLTVSVSNDLAAPILSIYTVAATPTGSYAISGSVSDNVAVGSVTVQVNKGVAVKAVISGTKWTSTLSGLIVGSNLITVRAADSSGNTALATTSIVVK